MTKKKTATKGRATSGRNSRTAGTGTSAVANALRVIEAAIAESPKGKASLEESMESRLCEMLDENDLVMVYDVRLLDRDGNAVVSSRGYASMANVGARLSKPEAPHVLERAFRNNVWRPMRDRFMGWVNADLLQGEKPVQVMEEEYGGNDDGQGPLGLPSGTTLSG